MLVELRWEKDRGEPYDQWIVGPGGSKTFWGKRQEGVGWKDMRWLSRTFRVEQWRGCSHGWDSIQRIRRE